MELASEYKIYIESPIFGHQKRIICFFSSKKTLVLTLAQQNRIPSKKSPPPKKIVKTSAMGFLHVFFFKNSGDRSIYTVLIFCGPNSTPVVFVVPAW